MTLSSCSISPTVGGDFSMFSGGVVGKVKELVPNSKIVQDWKFSQWGDVFSNLEISFVPVSENCTKLIVKQTMIPETDSHGNSRQDELVLSGWKNKFFLGLEKVLGFAVDRE
jgi:activator of HSP90 ATPase